MGVFEKLPDICKYEARLFSLSITLFMIMGLHACGAYRIFSWYETQRTDFVFSRYSHFESIEDDGQYAIDLNESRYVLMAYFYPRPLDAPEIGQVSVNHASDNRAVNVDFGHRPFVRQRNTFSPKANHGYPEWKFRIEEAGEYNVSINVMDEFDIWRLYLFSEDAVENYERDFPRYVLIAVLTGFFGALIAGVTYWQCRRYKPNVDYVKEEYFDLDQNT